MRWRAQWRVQKKLVMLVISAYRKLVMLVISAYRKLVMLCGGARSGVTY